MNGKVAVLLLFFLTIPLASAISAGPMCALRLPFQTLNRSVISYIVQAEASPFSCGYLLYYSIDPYKSVVHITLNPHNSTNQANFTNVSINYTASNGKVTFPQFNYTYTLTFSSP